MRRLPLRPFITHVIPPGTPGAIGSRLVTQPVTRRLGPLYTRPAACSLTSSASVSSPAPCAAGSGTRSCRRADRRSLLDHVLDPKGGRKTGGILRKESDAGARGTRLERFSQSVQWVADVALERPVRDRVVVFRSLSAGAQENRKGRDGDRWHCSARCGAGMFVAG